MFRQIFLVLVASVSLTILAGQAQSEDLWTLYEPVCNANGIDSDVCICILDEVVKTHGEQAARYVGLDMSMRHDEAGAILEDIGEDKAFAAGSMFDIAQNKNCAPGRIARLKGIYSNSGSNSVSGSASASDVADVSTSPGTAFKKVNVMTAGAPIFDLRAIDGKVIGDVTVKFGAGVSRTGGTANLGNFVGFYRIADMKGGIDTNGDGVADMRPGDESYTNHVQIHAESTKLYVSKNAGQEQYLGEIRLKGGTLYAPYFRFKRNGSPGVMPTGFPFDANDRKKMEEFLRSGMNNPSSLFFVFPAANTGGVKHFTGLGNNQLGFRDTPGTEGNAGDFDDAIFDFKFGF